MRLPYWTYDRLLGRLTVLEVLCRGAASATEKAAGDIAGAGLPLPDVAYAAMMYDAASSALNLAIGARMGFLGRNWPYDPDEERRQEEEQQRQAAAAAAAE